MIKTLLHPYVQASVRYFLTSLAPVVALFLAHDNPRDLLSSLSLTHNLLIVLGLVFA